MSFISFGFIFLFLIALIGRFWVGPTKVEKNYLILILILSLVFYASFIPAYLLLLFFTTLVDYYAGAKIFTSGKKSLKKIYLVFSLAANLGLLVFFKYSGFLLESLKYSFDFWGVDSSWVPQFDLILPIGISFFTFESMSYTIDIYRGELKPEESYWRFLLFVSF